MAADMAWGDHITLIAAAELFRTKIWILSSIDLPAQSKMSPVTIIEPSNMDEGKSIFLGMQSSNSTLVSEWCEPHSNGLQDIGTNAITPLSFRSRTSSALCKTHPTSYAFVHTPYRATSSSPRCNGTVTPIIHE